MGMASRSSSRTRSSSTTRLAVVGDEVGLLGRQVVVVLHAGRLPRRRRGHGQDADVLVDRDVGGLEAAGARDGDAGLEAAPDDDVGPALRNAEVEVPVLVGWAEVGPLEGAAHPGRPHRKAEGLSGGVEVPYGDGELAFGHADRAM